MRIAFLSQLLPLPLDAGPKIRAYYVLRQLAEDGHDVTLVCFVRSATEQAQAAELKRFCASVEMVPLARSRLADARDAVRSVACRTPFLVLRDQLASMRARLRTVVEAVSPDAIHADQLWMAPYAAAHRGGRLSVLDQHNAVFRIPQRLALQRRNPVLRALLRVEGARLEAFERRTVAGFDRVAWVSEEDRRACAGREPGPRHVVIPIAVDPTARPPIALRHPFRVTFLGGLHWPPNAEAVRWFADRVWPAVARAVPGAVFTVVGRNGARARLGDGARTVATGYVADATPLLEETAVFVVPLLSGAGMRVKILDAWCSALPVVSTSVGAEGLEAMHGENVLLADEPQAFAASVIRLLTDRAKADRIGGNGRATVEALYDWRKVYPAWTGIYH